MPEVRFTTVLQLSKAWLGFGKPISVRALLESRRGALLSGEQLQGGYMPEVRFTTVLHLFAALLWLASCSSAEQVSSPLPKKREIILATTTSTQDSGLLDELVPVFEESSGYLVKVIAVGTGQALKMGQRGDADILLVHAPAAEMELIEDGSATDRRLIMHNDFVIVGPLTDPAGIRGLLHPGQALLKISGAGSLFISRGDDSGTNKKELGLWQEAGAVPAGDWYLESGQGMGATLRIASEKNGYTLTDRATYMVLRDTLELEILVEGDPSLLNVYHVMTVNPDRWPAVNEAGAVAWSDFLTSGEGQEIIGAFGIDEFGQPLFFPDAGKTETELSLE